MAGRVHDKALRVAVLVARIVGEEGGEGGGEDVLGGFGGSVGGELVDLDFVGEHREGLLEEVGGLGLCAGHGFVEATD